MRTALALLALSSLAAACASGATNPRDVAVERDAFVAPDLPADAPAPPPPEDVPRPPADVPPPREVGLPLFLPSAGGKATSVEALLLADDGGVFVFGSHGYEQHNAEDAWPRPWVARLTADGHVVWQRVFESGRALGIAAASDGGVRLAGHVLKRQSGPRDANHTFTVFALDALGAVAWVHELEGAGDRDDDRGVALLAEGDGRHVAVGHLGAPGTPQPEGRVAVVALDAAGEPGTAAGLTATDPTEVTHAVAGPDGLTVLAGLTDRGDDGARQADRRAFLAGVTADGRLAWQMRYDPRELGEEGPGLHLRVESIGGVVARPEGGYALALTIASEPPRENPWDPQPEQATLVVLRAAADGTPEDGVRIVDANRLRVGAMAATSDGGLLLGGLCNAFGVDADQGLDGLLVALGPTLAIDWHREYGGRGVDEVRALLPLADGTWLVGGRTSSLLPDPSLPSEPAAWLFRVDAEGGPLENCVADAVSHRTLVASPIALESDSPGLGVGELVVAGRHTGLDALETDAVEVRPCLRPE